MSKWRQKGFVQDSDDDEEDSQESQPLRQDADLRRVERVHDNAAPEQGRTGETTHVPEDQNAAIGNAVSTGTAQVAKQQEPSSPPTQRLSPRRPTASPLTPAPTYEARKEPTESPDPLQSSPLPKTKLKKRLVSSQLLGPPVFRSSSPSAGPQLRRHVAVSSQLLGDLSQELQPPPRRTVMPTNVAPNILDDFGIYPLSDTSEDDALSDPPTDLDSPDTALTTPRPHRRTLVQVVIPSSTPLQRQIADQDSTRAFRQRKPIQLHPYALEGEMYRREVQSRGLKPVPRPRSPERRIRHPDAETQEKEFNPDEVFSSSPPEPEIAVSTPMDRRPRDDGAYRSSTRRRASDPQRRPLPRTQLPVPHAAKRRRLNMPATQGVTAPTSIFDDSMACRDIWSIPPNSPPYPSSPYGNRSAHRVGKLPSITPVPNLPTPSTSSASLEDPQQRPDWESDPARRSALGSGSGLHRPARVIPSDSSSSASDASSESEKSDSELRKVGKKIKGVLPASWLRHDQQAQAQKVAQARARERARVRTTLSPDPTEPQRGVAQRIPKRTGPARKAESNIPSDDIVSISDESDGELRNPVPDDARDVQNSIEDAASLAAAFDRRYADDDSDGMENDRLHLFTLAVTGAKRKRQAKLTDSFGKAKRVKSSTGNAKRSCPTGLGKTKHASSKKPRRTPPPALSVLDLDLSPSTGRGDIPQFLRVARRQALQRPDLGRQSPGRKQIRLHNVRDTEDANATLRQWRQGALKPKANVSTQRHQHRRLPLAEKVNNHRDGQHLTPTENSLVKETYTFSDTGMERSHCQKRAGMPSALQVLHRSSTQGTTSSQRGRKTTQPTRVLERSTNRAPHAFRTAQLQGNEGGFNHRRKKTTLVKGLHPTNRRPVTQVPNDHEDINPQLARFLADENAVLPPLPSAADIGGQQVEGLQELIRPPKRRLVRRKKPAQRVDVEAREYRQPSEPALPETFEMQTTDPVQGERAELDVPYLQGLGPFGTRYPTTFDVTCLQSDTYFHSSTFIGSEDLRRALSIGKQHSRDLDEPAGSCTIDYDGTTVRCGPWNDETSSGLHNIARYIITPLLDESSPATVQGEPLVQLAKYVRSLINYVSGQLSFSDPIDRQSFAVKMHNLIFTLFDQMSVVYATADPTQIVVNTQRNSLRIMHYLLVLSVQSYQIAQSTIVNASIRDELLTLTKSIGKALVTHALRDGISEVVSFLEQNKRHTVRQDGVQERDVVVESVVICMHALGDFKHSGFWDLVSQELSTVASSATHIQALETTWATLYTLLPFVEVDLSGIPQKGRRERFSGENWGCVAMMLRRICELYPSTYRQHSSSLNEYVRANLARCYRLIKHWYWRRPEPMLNVVLDFFGKNGLKQLRREPSSGSVQFLERALDEQSLSLAPDDCSFHIALKCLALGLQGMTGTYPDKKIRSFVFRTIPNHGRSYPKDQPLDEESLAALRNHHDLLCTLYCAAPPPCRPRLDLIRCLISHESSHREACRVNVRAWANLTSFQLSTDEPYTSAKSFALWHKDIMHQTLRQYRLAKTEADDYLKSGVLDGTTTMSATMVRQTMERNQEQVIATLRDCIAGMKKSFKLSRDATQLRNFLVDCDIVHLLELPHLEDRRLISVIRDTLALLRDFTAIHKFALKKNDSQQTSEESQDYGDFPDLDDLDESEPQGMKNVQQPSSLDFVQTPLWHLLSNAFGAEVSPDDNLLMDCVDTWVLVADGQVVLGERSWSYYVDSFSHVSWQQLRHTEQTRKFGPYFFAALVGRDTAVYDEHKQELVTALLLSLVDRESILRFQHRLLHAMVRVGDGDPLLTNLPFFHSRSSGEWDITADTLRSRRLALISSILSNMRDHLHLTARENPARTSEVKRTYAALLKDFMTRMKSNYQQLQQGNSVTGAYVEFVQKIVQFLKQYTSDISPVLPFFTDSVAFPVPAADPTYVVGRLCGYAPKAADSGTSKQLSMFIQTVAQQAAADAQQVYLVNQLTTALCSDEAPAADRTALRSVLLQGIFPAYLETAISSRVAFLIARPILQSLQSILNTMMFDLRVADPASVSLTVRSILSISHAFVCGTKGLKRHADTFQQPHVRATLTYTLDAMATIFPILDYICGRAASGVDFADLPLVAYMKDFIVYIAEMLRGAVPHTVPSYPSGNAMVDDGPHSSLFAFCKKGLEDSMAMNWKENAGAVWFGQGHAKREVFFEVEEGRGLVGAVAALEAVLENLCEEEGRGDGDDEDVVFV
jgi:hypothetical protein